MNRRVAIGLLLAAMLAGTACAAPFSIKVSVNGVDPSKETAVLRAGEAADVSIDVGVESGDIMVDSVEFNSDPSAIGGVLEAFMEKRVEFPKKLDPVSDDNAYELPGLVPAGDYKVTALIHYSGGQTGTGRYNANIRVENEGILSMILGLIVKIMPKFIVKPIAGLVI